ncbi:MAG TPA: putative protein N(5)-glutamine methyltransferase [Nevskiaceae bacterium]
MDADPGSGAAIETDAVVARLRAAGCVFAEDEALLLLEAARQDAPDRSFGGTHPAAAAMTDTSRDASALEQMIARRVAGEPLEYILGWVEFCGMRVAIDSGVFIPRQRTAFLAERAAKLAPEHPVILDLCCGCGAIGLAVHARTGGELHAADIEAVAASCARRNLDPVGGHVYRGDLFAPLPTELRGRIDVLTANVPYVPTGELDLMPVEAREHEPVVTHDGGTDGLDLARRVAAEAPLWLAASGRIFIETSVAQAPALCAAFAATGLDAVPQHDRARAATIVVAQLLQSSPPPPACA